MNEAHKIICLALVRFLYFNSGSSQTISSTIHTNYPMVLYRKEKDDRRTSYRLSPRHWIHSHVNGWLGFTSCWKFQNFPLLQTNSLHPLLFMTAGQGSSIFCERQTRRLFQTNFKSNLLWIFLLEWPPDLLNAMRAVEKDTWILFRILAA